MLTFEEARTRLLARAKLLGSERVAVSRARGRVLAEPVLSPSDLPPFSYSAMDGYALRSEALAGSGPFGVAVRGESRTGRLPDPDRKSTRLNSSHSQISYAVFCLKKKKKK